MNSIPTEILWLALVFLILISIVMWWVFHHHWSTYGLYENRKIFARSFFIIISVVVIIVMTVLILFKEVSL